MRLNAGVVPHDEVVPLGVLHLMARHGLRQTEGAPVRDVADDAAVSEDDLSGGEDDSVS